MTWRNRLKEKAIPLVKTVKDLSVRTKIEIGFFSALLGASSCMGGHIGEVARSQFQPLSFSEYEEIEDREIAGGPVMNGLTWYYAGTNDLVNKPFEAHNVTGPVAAYPPLRRAWRAQRLDQAMDTTQRTHRRNIVDFARLVPKAGRKALVELTDLRTASQLSNDMRAHFEGSWQYSRREKGHMQPYTVCTSNGKSTSCTVHFRYVCDNYFHTWTYNPAHGRRAAQLIDKAGTEVPAIAHLPILTSPKTEAWNEQRIRESFKREFDRDPTREEMIQRAQYFKSGSQYEQNIDPARGLWVQITNGDAATWQRMHTTARTVADKKTGCHSVPGPDEYEFAQQMQGRLSTFIQHEQNITQPIVQTIAAAPKLERTIKEFILAQEPTWAAHYTDINPDSIRQSASKLEGEVIKQARAIYAANIPGGNPTTEYRLWVPFVWLLGGALVGAGIGFGVDAAVEKYVAPGYRKANGWTRNHWGEWTNRRNHW
jgi:hypothetical protein